MLSDYYLFDDVIHGASLPEEALPYLKKLEISDKVEVRDGRLAGLLGIATTNIIVEVIVAFIGAVILLVILRAVTGRSRRTA